MFRIERADGVARVAIDRADKRNAVPIAGWNALGDAIADGARGAAALVLVSAVPGVFCAGADIAEFGGLRDDVPARAAFRRAMGDALDRLRACPVPTMAVIAGGCFGAGVALALACDTRIAAPDARFSVPPARLGIGFPQPDIDALVAAVGRGQAARLLFGAETIDAEEALRIGLVETVSADGGATEIARIAGNAPGSLAMLKAGLLGLPGADERFETAFGSGDFAEGHAAFVARRPPAFAR